jgi:hypothetical protein
MRVLCEAGARLDYVYSGGDTILHRTVQLGTPDLSGFLLIPGQSLYGPRAVRLYSGPSA